MSPARTKKVWREERFTVPRRMAGSHQAVVQSGDYGGCYVDNCRNVAVGATAPLEVQ